MICVCKCVYVCTWECYCTSGMCVHTWPAVSDSQQALKRIDQCIYAEMWNIRTRMSTHMHTLMYMLAYELCGHAHFLLHAQIYIHTKMNTRTHTRTHTRIRTRAHARTHTNTYTHKQTHTYTHAHTHTHTHTRAHEHARAPKHTHAHTHMYQESKMVATISEKPALSYTQTYAHVSRKRNGSHEFSFSLAYTHTQMSIRKAKWWPRSLTSSQKKSPTRACRSSASRNVSFGGCAGS